MSASLEVHLLGKSYRVACTSEEREALLLAVDLLDGKLKEAGEKTRSSGERLAVMVALNLAHELLAARNTPAEAAADLERTSIQRRIDSIEARLDESLKQHAQLF